MKEETKKGPNIATLSNPGGNRSAGSGAGVGGPPNIMTMAQLHKEQTTDISKPVGEQRRKIKGSEEEILKKIAHADAVNKHLVK